MFGKLANQWCIKLLQGHGPTGFPGLKLLSFLETPTLKLLLYSPMRKAGVKAVVEAAVKAAGKVSLDNQAKVLATDKACPKRDAGKQ